MTEHIAGCVSAPRHISRTSYADTRRGNIEERQGVPGNTPKGKIMFYLRRIDQAQGLVLLER